jgi:hypothetical protein
MLVVLMTIVTVAQAPERTTTAVTGKWLMTLDMSMGTASPTLTIKQDGDKLTGTYAGRYGTFDITGKMKGRIFEFSFQMNEAHPVSICFTGEVTADGQKLEGTAVLAEMGEATWTAEKDKDGK